MINYFIKQFKELGFIFYKMYVLFCLRSHWKTPGVLLDLCVYFPTTRICQELHTFQIFLLMALTEQRQITLNKSK